ncbi:MAG: hypothetical protein JSW16_01105 [Dehalococcoidales bacterium]|nr:MAG: hypothetical protein JSW16_01105 [Dehalococcoidales bacterium]
MTLQDALVAYKTYARAEGKSPKTVAWVASSVGYFADFLGPEQQDIEAHVDLAHALSKAEWDDLLFIVRFAQLVVLRALNDALREKEEKY